MSNPTLSATTSSDAYPPDLRVVAEELFLHLLQRDQPIPVHDLRNAWLTFYTLKHLAIPPFTHFPTHSHPAIHRSLRQYLRSEPVIDTLPGYFLNPLAVDRGTHVSLYRAAGTVAQSDEVTALDCQNIVNSYATYRASLEATYRQRLATYWVHPEQGRSRRALFITGQREALLVEAEAAVEQGLLTTSQHGMLQHVLDTPDEAGAGLRRHGVFHLLLASADGAEEMLPGAFVVTHAQSLQAPAPDDHNLGEALLYTEQQGLEGYDSVAQMMDSLAVRFNDATQRQVLVQNLSKDQRERLSNRATAANWRLSVMSGDLLQTLFDLQVARQQSDFSHIVREARATKMPAQAFVRKVHMDLAQAAHLDNAYRLERNDRRLIDSNMPPWWSQTDAAQQQRWVEAVQRYGQAITELHQLCSQLSDDPPTATTHQAQWLDNVRRLATAQMHMGQVQASAERLPAQAQAWIKAVIESPDAGYRRTVDGKVIQVDFMTLGPDTLADVMRIAPAGSGDQDPRVLCTLNAPDSRVFRWFPNEETLHEGFLDQPHFARYLLRQLPKASRPDTCTAQQYEQWLKYYRAGSTFEHLTAPAPLTRFVFRGSGYIAQGQDFLRTHYDLKQRRSSGVRIIKNDIASQGSVLGSIALGIAMLYIPSPVLIALAGGVALFKVWNSFKHLEQGDYRGAAFELTCAIGYLAAAAVGKWMIDSRPFVALEEIRPAPPLVLRAAADGEEQISYLARPGIAAHLPTMDAQAPYNADQFGAISIHDHQYFVKKQPWLFGHRQLYEVDAHNPNLLIGTPDYVVQDRLGIWRRISAMQATISRGLLRRADAELASLTSDWPETLDQVSPAMKIAFEVSYMRLAATSNAAEFAEISEYCEGGSGAINTLLRAGLQTSLTRRFIKQFYCLHEYNGLAYRVATVSLAGLRRLTMELGQVFVDNGIQSASTTRWNAEQWSRDEFIQPASATESKMVCLIFDASIAKKNLFTSFFGDHVAIAPSTPLQLVASRQVGERFFAYFTRPTSCPAHLVNLYSGGTELML